MSNQSGSIASSYEPLRSMRPRNKSMRRAIVDACDKYFAVSERNSTFRTEIRAGFVNFLANSYLLVVIPQILDRNGNGLDKDNTSTAFLLTTCISSILVGLLSNLPVPAGPGLGGATFVAYSIFDLSSTIDDDDKKDAFTTCLIAAFVMLVMSPIACLLVSFCPKSVTSAIPVGLGLLFAMVGFMEMGLVIPDADQGLRMGSFKTKLLLSSIGLIPMAYLHKREVHCGMALVILAIAFCAWGAKIVDWPSSIVEVPSFSDVPIDFRALASVGDCISRVLGLYLIATFDIFGIAYGVGLAGGLVHKGKGDGSSQLPGLMFVFVSCGLGSVVAALLGATPVIALGESFAGVIAGGRTGLTAIVFAMFMLLTLPFLPLVSAVPDFATSPVLVLLGVNLMSLLKNCDFEDTLHALPSFLVIVLMPFTGSIDRAILAGLASHVLLILVDYVVTKIVRSTADSTAVESDDNDTRKELKIAASYLCDADDEDYGAALRRVESVVERVRSSRENGVKTSLRRTPSALERTGSQILSSLENSDLHAIPHSLSMTPKLRSGFSVPKDCHMIPSRRRFSEEIPSKDFEDDPTA